jgi:hypothetical protein
MYIYLWSFPARGLQMPLLPEIRTDFGGNANWVARALSELTKAGLVSSRRVMGNVVQYDLVPIDEATPREPHERPKGTGFRPDFDRLYALWPYKWEDAQAWDYFRRTLRPTPDEVDVMAQAILAQYDGIPGDRVRFAGKFRDWLMNRRWELNPETVRAGWEMKDGVVRRRPRPDEELTPNWPLCKQCGKRRPLYGETICPPCQLGRG